MMKFTLLSTGLLMLASSMAYGQMEQKPLTISGYGEVYYGYDFNQPSDNNRPSFIYSHNRHNEVNVNLAMLKASYQKDRLRGNIGIMTGTYANANLAAEPGVLQNLWEANVGIRLHDKRDLWLDAGVMPSHIGPEGAISMDYPTLTRSMFAEGSPYYESGVKLGYSNISGSWYFAVMYLNGWQRIYRPNGNSTPAGGTQITYTPNDKLTVNWSTFVGSDSPDSSRVMRYFSDLYAILKVGKKIEITALYDAGVQQQFKGSSTVSDWFTVAVIGKYKLSEKFAIAARAEYFDDTYGVINFTPFGFYVQAYSVNFDYQVLKNLVWRTEMKVYKSNKTDVFMRDGLPINTNAVATTSLAFKFKK